MKLHLGAGSTRLDGWTNVDGWAVDGVTDLVVNLDDPDHTHLPFDDGTVEEIFSSHFIEHIRHPLPLMQELWRVAKDGCKATFKCPYGSSDDADEDPTHVRRLFLNSWGYFSQPFHWRSAGYGYTADWAPRKIQLALTPDFADEVNTRGSQEWMVTHIMRARNTVQEMTAVLEAVKPARPREKGLQDSPDISFARAVLA